MMEQKLQLHNYMGSLYGIENYDPVLNFNMKNDYIPIICIRHSFKDFSLRNFIYNKFDRISKETALLSRNEWMNKTTNILFNNHIQSNININNIIVKNQNISYIGANTNHYFNLSTIGFNYLNFVKSKYQEQEVYYYTGKGMMGISDIGYNLIETKYILLVKREIVENLHLFYEKIENNENSDRDVFIPTKYLKLWVKPDIGIKKEVTSHPHLKSYYNKLVLSKCNELGIKIEIKESFKDLFNNTTIPKIVTLKETQEVYRNEAWRRLQQC